MNTPKDHLDAAINTIYSLKEAGMLPEPERARIHALTRKATMSDDELAKTMFSIVPTINPESNELIVASRSGVVFVNASHVLKFARDLRDRYEGLGKYAPETAPAPQPEEVKP